MTVQLSDEAQAFVKSQLATGHFADESEVVSRLLEYLQGEKKRWEAETYAKVQESMKSVAEGRVVKMPEGGVDELLRRYRDRLLTLEP